MSNALMPLQGPGEGYSRLQYRLGPKGELVPEQGGVTALGLEPGATVVLWVPQTGAGGGVMYGGAMQGSQPVIVTAPAPQSPQVLVISNEAKKTDAKPPKPRREPFKNL